MATKPNIRAEKLLGWRFKDSAVLIRIGRTPMMWTDLHRGHLAQMKKCISTETNGSPENAQLAMIDVCGIPGPVWSANRIAVSKLR